MHTITRSLHTRNVTLNTNIFEIKIDEDTYNSLLDMMIDMNEEADVRALYPLKEVNNTYYLNIDTISGQCSNGGTVNIVIHLLQATTPHFHILVICE
jgi:hypothetical protein